MSARTLDIYLSGGASNSNPQTSLGGLKSSVLLYGQTVTYNSTPLSGVALLDAAGVSNGTLHFTKTGNLLGFQKAGGAVPAAAQWVTVSTTGKYTLECPETGQFVTVSVTFASLPSTDAIADITATSINQNLFDDVTLAEASAGAVEYRHFYITNNTANSVVAKLYIQQQFTGLDYLELGIKNLVSGFIDELLPDTATPPADVTFYPASSLADALVLSFYANDSVGVYLKRTVTALSDHSNPADTAIIALEVST